MAPPMHKMPYPIETEEAMKFWASRHLCNRMKAIIAFSKDVPDAMFNLRRFKYPASLRLRALLAYQNFVNKPAMDIVPFTPMEIHWTECMPKEPVPPTKGRWAIWDDLKDWDDGHEWIEWIPDPDPIPPTP